MSRISKKTAERIAAGLKRFQPVLQSAKDRDVNESDTVVIVTDLLQEVFGYDKYTEITSEHMIRGTFCDLAVKLDGTLALLIEVKAIGLELKEQQIKQAVDYAANQGCDWVVLTNGIVWRVYKVLFSKPIEHEMVVSFDLLAMNQRNAEHVQLLALLAKEGWQKAHIGEYHSLRQALSRFTLGALLLSDTMLETLRREVRRLSPEVRIETDEIRDVLMSDVLKREVLEGEKADAARKQIAKCASRLLRTHKPYRPVVETALSEDSAEPDTAAATAGA